MPVVGGTVVVKRWGATTALAGATFEIGAGVTGLLGANGAGKTTLLGLILGLHRPDGGEIEVLGLDPSTAGPAVRERLGYAPEHDALPPDVRAATASSPTSTRPTNGSRSADKQRCWASSSMRSSPSRSAG